MDLLAEHSWSQFYYSPLITSGSAGRVQLVTRWLLSTHHPWISWQSTAGHTAVTLHSSPVCQLAEHTGHTSVTLHSTPVCQLAENSWSHFCYSPFITRGSAGKAQLVTVLLHSTHHPWISWQITAGHISVTLHSSPVDQLAEYSWSQFCYSPLITRGSAGRVQLVTLLLLFIYNRGSAGRLQLVTLLLLSSHHPCVSWKSTLVTLRLLSIQHPCVSWQSTAGHTSVTLQSSAVDQLASTAGHTSVTLHSSPVDQLAEYSGSHFCYSPIITCGSAGKAQLVTLLLLSSYHRGSADRAQLDTLLLLHSHHPCVSWQSTLVTLQLLSTQHPCVSWQSTSGHTSVTLQSSPVDQLAKHSWSHFCYSPVITFVSASKAHWSHFCYSPLNTVCQLAEHSCSHFCYSPVITLDQLAKHSWSHFCFSPLITRGSVGRVQLVTFLLLSNHHPWIGWQSTAGHTSVTLHSSPVDQLAE